jgi:hypothetical protein
VERNQPRRGAKDGKLFKACLKMQRQPSWLTWSRGFQPGGRSCTIGRALKNLEITASSRAFPGGRMPALYGRQDASRYIFRQALQTKFLCSLRSFAANCFFK